MARVVLPAHDAEETLARQLDALANQSGAPDFEVVVVLNRCTDDSASVARSFASRLRLQIVEANRLPSAAHARNVGAEGSSAPFLLFCDADDRVDQRWVAAMVSALQGGADFVGGRIVVDRNGLPSWIYRWRYESMDGRCTAVGPTALPYAFGASLACTRAAFEQVSGFDETFLGAGSEEVEIAARLLRRGFRIGEAPDAIVSYRPRTTMKGALAQTRGYARGQIALEAREGRIQPPLPRSGMAKRLLRRIAHLVVRKREWPPQVVCCRIAEEFYRLDEWRRWWTGRPRADIITPPVEDFATPTSTPLIGGLALSARRAQARWYASRGIEQRSLAIVEALFPHSGVFVDCGANVGVFTLAAALRGGPDCRVIAFEPDPRTMALLEQNLRRHSVLERVDLRVAAVGDARGHRSFNQYENDPLSGFGLASEDSAPGDVVDTIVVDVVRLTDAIDGPVDMVKIDVEGFEPAVLRGASGLLGRSPDAALIVELNPAALRALGHTAADLLHLLPPDRWVRWLIDDHADPGSDAIRAVDRDASAFISGADASWYGNLLAVPLHRAAPASAFLDSLEVHR